MTPRANSGVTPASEMTADSTRLQTLATSSGFLALGSRGKVGFGTGDFGITETTGAEALGGAGAVAVGEGGGSAGFVATVSVGGVGGFGARVGSSFFGVDVEELLEDECDELDPGDPTFAVIAGIDEPEGDGDSVVGGGGLSVGGVGGVGDALAVGILKGSASSTSFRLDDSASGMFSATTWPGLTVMR